MIFQPKTNQAQKWSEMNCLMIQMAWSIGIEQWKRLCLNGSGTPVDLRSQWIDAGPPHENRNSVEETRPAERPHVICASFFSRCSSLCHLSFHAWSVWRTTAPLKGKQIESATGWKHGVKFWELPVVPSCLYGHTTNYIYYPLINCDITMEHHNF